MKSSEKIKDLKRLRRWIRMHPRKAMAAKIRWVQNNKDRHRAYHHQWYLENKERMDQMRRLRHLKNPSARKKMAALYREKHPHRIIEMGRIARYGVTNGKVTELMKAQGYRCAICSLRFNSTHSRRRCIDHCHKTKIVRGILCHKCNIGLGHFNDNHSLLLKAVKYLTR